jgi:hypothetical protein
MQISWGAPLSYSSFDEGTFTLDNLSFQVLEPYEYPVPKNIDNSVYNNRLGGANASLVSRQFQNFNNAVTTYPTGFHTINASAQFTTPRFLNYVPSLYWRWDGTASNARLFTNTQVFGSGSFNQVATNPAWITTSNTNTYGNVNWYNYNFDIDANVSEIFAFSGHPATNISVRSRHYDSARLNQTGILQNFINFGAKDSFNVPDFTNTANIITAVVSGKGTGSARLVTYRTNVVGLEGLQYNEYTISATPNNQAVAGCVAFDNILMVFGSTFIRFNGANLAFNSGVLIPDQVVNLGDFYVERIWYNRSSDKIYFLGKPSLGGQVLSSYSSLNLYEFNDDGSGNQILKISNIPCFPGCNRDVVADPKSNYTFLAGTPIDNLVKTKNQSVTLVPTSQLIDRANLFGNPDLPASVLTSGYLLSGVSRVSNNLDYITLTIKASGSSLSDFFNATYHTTILIHN